LTFADHFQLSFDSSQRSLCTEEGNIDSQRRVAVAHILKSPRQLILLTIILHIAQRRLGGSSHCLHSESGCWFNKCKTHSPIRAKKGNLEIKSSRIRKIPDERNMLVIFCKITDSRKYCAVAGASWNLGLYVENEPILDRKELKRECCERKKRLPRSCQRANIIERL